MSAQALIDALEESGFTVTSTDVPEGTKVEVFFEEEDFVAVISDKTELPEDVISVIVKEIVAKYPLGITCPPGGGSNGKES